MAYFGSYNTSDPNTGSAPLAANAAIDPIIIQTPMANTVGGTIASDQGGTLTASQSFDGVNWDGPVVFTDADNSGTAGVDYLVVAGTPRAFTFDVIAPYVQITYTNGGTAQGYMRLFVRSFGLKSGG